MKWPWQKKVDMPPEVGLPGPVESPPIEEPKLRTPLLFYPGRVVTIDGFKFRITEAKPNGRLFLKQIR